ncbi:hypothetical protein CAI21_13450 [Alkalilimnicola ehrlichii]|uniref:Cysteine-rich domain-containing protein n=1 Tax=Alkalilimnicola ehrlichii TaxID=351052 RepID=A0A3E0WI54_9GAMM|nr:(Fe-S)-binding protein [Alkalilimnicola ehrlichii]RFA28311.1 hypothetical protein CAI21_13450 [Alkalilimnicola ehrlichii]RFA31646.1 hypothetical protein CAL65_21885 [Alkalilimnicola ehrlichii]
MSNNDTQEPLTVALFATCLVDLLRPEVGFATAKLIQACGFRVEVPKAQTCCAQPAYNAGDWKTARALAQNNIALLEDYDYVVVPSGSCVGTFRDYTELFAEDDVSRQQAEQLSAKTFELTDFLLRHNWQCANPRAPGHTVSYHDSCSNFRQLNVREQPRTLLRQAGYRLTEVADPEVCCGFGGAFCIKYADLSARLGHDKAASITATGSDLLLGGDLGCLLHLAGTLSRQNSPIKVFHVAEALVGELAGTGISGEGSKP